MKTEKQSENTKCLFDDIVSVAKGWNEFAPGDAEQCLRVSISEYDAWSDIDRGLLNYDELLKEVLST